MSRQKLGALAGALLATLAACSDGIGSDVGFDPRGIGAAFTQAPVAAGDLSTSWVGARAEHAGDSMGFMGRGHGGHGPRRGELMGGGLGDAFTGAMRFEGRGAHRGPFAGVACEGTFDAATGRVACAPVTVRNGLTVTRSIAYADAAGAVQQAFDTATTDRVDVRTAVSGTITFTRDGAAGEPRHGGRHGGRHHGGPGGRWGRLFGDTATILDASTVVSNASDRSVTGLAAGSASRSVAGTSRSSETTTGTSSRGSFTVTRLAGDTTTGLVIPVSTTGPSYPTAGTVVRSMKATLTYGGQAAVEATRREVVTYDGTATAKVVITQDGTTRNCTRPLPRGPLSCS